MSDLTRADMEFIAQFLSSNDECACAPGDYHEVESTDWRRILRILHRLNNSNESDCNHE